MSILRRLPATCCAAWFCLTLWGTPSVLAGSYESEGFLLGDVGLTESQRLGRRIWMYATAGNDRFHTYVLPQRLGVFSDWHRVLDTRERDDRFSAWGLINDPDCCTPGARGCPAKSLDETYGFDYCPGDEELLRYVGKAGYPDPACTLKDVSRPADPHGDTRLRHDSCDLAFGSSSGVLGLRKFPNPRFDPEAWRRVNGQLGSWSGISTRLSTDRSNADFGLSRLMDSSIEPPFRMGMACGACHISFDPANPPSDPAHPKWENIAPLVGNQYARISELLASGMPSNSLEWQIFAHARPGTVDTSAVPNDQVNNPGTMNALINLSQRPTFEADVIKWRKTSECPDGSDERECWCEPGLENKCWEHGLVQNETVHHILKGGEDSIGLLEALQRVYLNIGTCAEACTTNHITDLRQADPAHRGFGQSPVDIGQCRRNCPNFRAVEDRLEDIAAFLATARPTDLWAARGASATQQVAELNAEFGEAAVERGRAIYAERCARCHSSQQPANTDFSGVDFHATHPDDPSLRVDWLGNDAMTPATHVGTNLSRALHSNHMQGHVWQEFGSETLRLRPVDPGIRVPADGGRGYYRNISLLSLWAHAPFMHNNGIGPELCGKPANRSNDFYRSPYVNHSGAPLAGAPACWRYDPSTEGRYRLFKASVDALLNPDRRSPKVMLVSEDIHINVGPRLIRDGKETGIQLVIPAGLPVSYLGGLDHKGLVADVVNIHVNPERFETKYEGRLEPAGIDALAAELRELSSDFVDSPSRVIRGIEAHREMLEKHYLNSTATFENAGHRFGSDLSERDKRALTAFLATL